MGTHRNGQAISFGFFEQFYLQLQNINTPKLEVLELGSGPGFLAVYLLEKLPNLKITLLDFSHAMHELAKNRLNFYLDRVTFLERDFKISSWNIGLSQFDAVITNQAVHELRHKDYAKTLHEEVKPLINKEGIYLVCDHYYENSESDSEKATQLYMNLDEYCTNLRNAGYSVNQVLVKGGRILCHATLNK